MSKRFTKEQIKEYIGRESYHFSKLLIFSYLMALLAPLYYFFDLFSHFTLQYTIGGIVLSFGLLFGKRYKIGALVVFITLLCIIESRALLQHPLVFKSTPAQEQFKLVTYNQNFARQNFSVLEAWLKENEETFDFIILQEATQFTVELAKTFANTYPHQIHEPRDDAFGFVILSKYDFEELDHISLNGPYYPTIAVRAKIKPNSTSEPITVYTIHPYPPVGPLAWQQRDFELLETARAISKDDSKNIILIGDINITPFSPTFKTLIKTSGLNYQAYGFLLNGTWPSFLFFPFLKIPIDHAFYSDDLIQTSKEVGPALLSDHHPLIVGFAEK